MSNEQNSGDLINLEDIVRDLGSNTPAPKISESRPPSSEGGGGEKEGEKKNSAPATSSKASDEQPAAQQPRPLDDDQLDSLLSEGSPEFAASLKEIREAQEGLSAEADIAPLESDAEVRDLVVANLRGLTLRDRIKFLRQRAQHRLADLWRWCREKFAKLFVYLKTEGRAALIAGLQLLVQKLRELLRATIDRVERARRDFSALSAQQKLAVIGALGATALAGWIVLRMLDEQLLPPSKRPWIGAMSDVADRKFEIRAGASFEDFNDPLLHPEFIVLLERVIVNLARTPESRGVPMALVDLFLQSDRRETAVELKDREIEVRDTVARAIEGMTYPELAEEAGKTKMKLLVRRDLNNLLTQGKVRRVYIKTIVLNPDET
ncbi:MAG TPA: flagellar basal body-associated FliL family protein [Pseudobdellovibrionaceae bacterium]|nr:flagellar basal body-associated FliL family protein [Pseudobdellovibrionaceae bacterium]